MKKLLFVSFLDASCCTRNGMCVCKCACAYIYIHAYIHISTHMYIHIHAYIYTYMDILRLEISCHMTLCVFVSITYLKMVPCGVHSKKTVQHFGGFQEIARAFCFLIICAEISHHFSKTIFRKIPERMRWTLLEFFLKKNRSQLTSFINSKIFSTFRGVSRLFANTKVCKN